MPDIQEARLRLEPAKAGGKGFKPFSGFQMKLPSMRLFSKGETQPDVSVQVMTPETLSEQLRVTAQNNDRPNLERLIQVAEEVQYPELGLDLREARESLHKMGGGYGGTITPEIVRPKLKAAIESKDTNAIDTIVRQSTSLGLPGLEVDIQEARENKYKLDGSKGGFKSRTLFVFN